MKPFSDIPPTDPPDLVPDEMPDTLATPEGDAEDSQNQPLQPAEVLTPERPRGNEPHYTQPIRKALE
jgi:hypothetical protein